jgi:hypothetical protein
MARVIVPGATVSGYYLPGVYEFILAQEMAMNGTVDPRYLFMVNEGEVQPPPAERQRVWSKILPDMLAGRPVVISAGRLTRMPTPTNVWPFNSRRVIRAYEITVDDIVSAAEPADVRVTQPDAPAVGRAVPPRRPRRPRVSSHPAAIV